jgi:hypothetical protein
MLNKYYIGEFAVRWGRGAPLLLRAATCCGQCAAGVGPAAAVGGPLSLARGRGSRLS